MSVGRGGLLCKLAAAAIKARAPRSQRPGLGDRKAPKHHQPPFRLDPIDECPSLLSVRAPRPTSHQSPCESTIKVLKRERIIRLIPRSQCTFQPPTRVLLFQPDVRPGPRLRPAPLRRARHQSTISHARAARGGAGQLGVRGGGAPQALIGPAGRWATPAHLPPRNAHDTNPLIS